MPYNTMSEGEPDWSESSNCYAYACNDRNPSNGYFGGAIPGAVAGKPEFPGPDYYKRLIVGAVADGLQHLPENDLSNLPGVRDGFYLVLLMANQTGFHWMRHDPFLDRWSWKTGNSGEVSYSVFSIPQNHCVYIKMRNLAESLTADENNYIWTTGMQFVAFF